MAHICYKIDIMREKVHSVLKLTEKCLIFFQVDIQLKISDKHFRKEVGQNNLINAI